MSQYFHILGDPIPQGSKTAKVINNKVIMWESNKHLKSWRDKITQQVATEMTESYGSDVAIRLVLHFQFLKPKTVKRLLPTVKPDLDKLARAVLDALTKSKIYHDDAQVVSLRAYKNYVPARQGVSIVIEII